MDREAEWRKPSRAPGRDRFLCCKPALPATGCGRFILLFSAVISSSKILLFLTASCIGVACAVRPARAEAPTSLAEGIVLPEQLFPTLDRILAEALRQSPQAVRASAEVLIAEQMEEVARARLRPYVGGSGTYSGAQERRLDRAGSYPAEKLTYNFGLTQPLYHWGALRDGVRVAQISSLLAEKNQAEAMRILVLDLRQVFLRLVVEKAGLKRLETMVKLAEEDLRALESRIDSGAAPKGELFGAQLRLEEARLEWERGREALRYNQAALERLAGIPPLAVDEIPDTIPPLPPLTSGPSLLLARFEGDRDAGGDFRLSALNLQLEQERLNFRITDVNLRPKFNVVSGAMQDEVSYTGSPADRARIQSFYAGINLTWTLFDGYATRAQRKASLLRTRQIEGERNTRRSEVVERARNQARLLEIAQRQTAVGEGRLAQLDGLVRFQQEEVARGNLSRRDAAAVALSRDEVLVRTFAYRVEYLGRLAEFLSVIGRDPLLVRLSDSRP